MSLTNFIIFCCSFNDNSTKLKYIRFGQLHLMWPYSKHLLDLNGLPLLALWEVGIESCWLFALTLKLTLLNISVADTVGAVMAEGSVEFYISRFKVLFRCKQFTFVTFCKFRTITKERTQFNTKKFVDNYLMVVG